MLADNIVATLRGKPLSRLQAQAYVGSVASLGLHKGVAQVYGVKLRGFPAWFMHRTYHLSRMPTFNSKVRVVARLDARAVLPAGHRLARRSAAPPRGLRSGHPPEAGPPA